MRTVRRCHTASRTRSTDVALDGWWRARTLGVAVLYRARMAGWRDRWRAVVTGDVPDRGRRSWEFASRDRGIGAWSVFREDDGPLPVFSSARGTGLLPPRHDLQAMTEAAVADLLAAPGPPDEADWIGRNITAALLMASLEIASWEGEEWALESDDRDEPTAWAGPEDARTPYSWLRARSDRGDAVVDVYQDDAVFGLSFVPVRDPQLPRSDAGSRRARRDIPLVTGPVHQVEVVYDTVVEGGVCPGLVTEVLLHGDDRSTLLIAAEAYSRSEWHLYDESVVALTDPAAADALEWLPGRQSWRPSGGPRS
jgi:hypothetical protein